MRSVFIVASLALAACQGADEPIPDDAPVLQITQTAASLDACELIPAIRVEARSNGVLDATYGGDVTLSIVSGTGVPGAVLSGTLTVRAVAGVAVFNDLAINASGVGYRLRASATAATAATTPMFDVIPGGPFQLAFTTAPPTGLVSLTLPVVRVTVRDACGSPWPGASHQISIALNANSASATLAGTTTVNAMNAVATFGDLVVSKNGPGYTLAATSPGLLSAQSIAFTVAAPAGMMQSEVRSSKSEER